MYRNLIVGAGEVGTALYRVLVAVDPLTFVRDVEDLGVENIDVLHICFPPSRRFAEQVREYIEQYDPTLTIVYSSTPVGTCEEIGYDVVHSPVEGTHPQLDTSFLLFTRWIGCFDDRARDAATRFWYRIARDVSIVKSSRYTEFMKLRSTAKYGVNLVWTDYEKQVADELGMNYDAVKGYDESYNKLYRDLGLYKYQRYVLDPPEGVIGGHCIVPNAEILDRQYPSPMLKAIKKMRKK